jgi:hypothetical protein
VTHGEAAGESGNYRYNTPAQLLSELSDRVIKPSEAKALELD